MRKLTDLETQIAQEVSMILTDNIPYENMQSVLTYSQHEKITLAITNYILKTLHKKIC